MVVAQYVLTFREVLEAALLAAIILAFLVKTGRSSLARYAWYGVYAATAASFGIGAAVLVAYGTLSEVDKVLFEGMAALIAVAVLTSMIYWMAVRGRAIKGEVESRVEAAVTHGAMVGLASLTFVLVFREGLETVLFLTPFLVEDVGSTVLGALLGLGAGIALAYAIFRVGLKLDLRKFFYFTSILLILIAGGLAGYGVHELIKYAELRAVDLGWFGATAYALPILSDSLFGHKGAIGSIFAVMFGYTTSSEWGRLVVHVTYLAIALPLIIIVYRRPGWIRAFTIRLRGISGPRAATGATDPREH